MRRAATFVPYGDYWVPMLNGHVPVATNWRDIAGRDQTAREFVEDIKPDAMTRELIAAALETWAQAEDNHHPKTNYWYLATRLLSDWQDEADEAAALAEGDA